MSDTPIEFFYDVVSPYSHFAAHTADKLAETTGRTVRWRAFFLGGVLRASGNSAPATVPAKGAHLRNDFVRESARLGVPFSFHPGFPMNTLAIQRALCGLEARDEVHAARVAKRLFDAMWVENVRADDLERLGSILTDVGVAPADFLAGAQDPMNKARLKANSDEAVARGAFGAPTFFVGDEMWWGHDRMDQLAFCVANGCR